MTRGYWTCKVCEYTMDTHLTSFINQCPQCKTEYELLGFLHNLHICHDIPISRVKGESFSEYITNQYYLIVQSSQKPEIRCINKDFYRYLSNLPNYDLPITFIEDESKI